MATSGASSVGLEQLHDSERQPTQYLSDDDNSKYVEESDEGNDSSANCPPRR